jgi:hypothetical protein
MGFEAIANSLSPVESVGLTLLEAYGDWARVCAQTFPSPRNLGDGGQHIKSCSDLRLGPIPGRSRQFDATLHVELTEWERFGPSVEI